MTTPSDFDIAVEPDVRRLRRTISVNPTWPWFARLWAVAVIAHVVGNPRVGQLYEHPTALGWTTWLTGLVAAYVLVNPSQLRWLRVMCVGVIVTVWFEAPFIGNHWLLAGIVSAAVLIALSGPEPWTWFTTAGRGVHIVFYAFAAFAKMNTSFLDASVSCGVHYANESLTAVGFSPVTGWLASSIAYGSAAIELAIPVLLLIPRTRRVGVLTGLVFHALISFDLSQHFYDFTSVLFPLFLLWTTSNVPQPIGTKLGRPSGPVLGATAALFVTVSVFPLTPITYSILTDAVFVVWIPFAIWLVALAVVRSNRTIAEIAVRPQGLVMSLLVALVVLNGVTPYFEIKTATSWNMYSNLHTAAGRTNHLIIRRTLPLADGLVDPYTIVSSSDPGLAAYVNSDYALPERTLRDYLADHPDASAIVSKAGRTFRVDATDAAALDPLTDRFALLRAIDTRPTTRCQTMWLPAR